MGDSFVSLVIDFVYKLFTKIIAFEPYMVLFFLIMAEYFILGCRGWNIEIFLYLKKSENWLRWVQNVELSLEYLFPCWVQNVELSLEYLIP